MGGCNGHLRRGLPRTVATAEDSQRVKAGYEVLFFMRSETQSLMDVFGGQRAPNVVFGETRGHDKGGRDSGNTNVLYLTFILRDGRSSAPVRSIWSIPKHGRRSSKGSSSLNSRVGPYLVMNHCQFGKTLVNFVPGDVCRFVVLSRDFTDDEVEAVELAVAPTAGETCGFYHRWGLDHIEVRCMYRTNQVFVFRPDGTHIAERVVLPLTYVETDRPAPAQPFISLGPILGFRGQEDGRWSVSVIAVADITANKSCPATLRWRLCPSGSVADSSTWSEYVEPERGDDVAGSRVLWGWRFSVQQPAATEADPHGAWCEYMWAEAPPLGAVAPPAATNTSETFRFWVPAQGCTPSIFSCSCNGHGEMTGLEQDMHSNEEAYRMWEVMLELHEKNPVGLLVMGGDQIYADHIWSAGLFSNWVALASEEMQKEAAFTDEMREQAELLYLETYTSIWNATAAERRVLASVPSLMMWDDHDIFDGWGSHKAEMQVCPVLQGIYAAARRFFVCLQLRLINNAWHQEFSSTRKVMQNWPDTSKACLAFTKSDRLTRVVAPKCWRDNFTYVHQFGRVVLVVLDNRSERTKHEVMSKETWDALFERLKSVDEDSVDHFIFVVPVPMVYVDMSIIEAGLRITRVFRRERASEMDDLADHWTHARHRDERMSILTRFAQLGALKTARVTLVSGDVHVGAYGCCEVSGIPGNIGEVTQFISSGIVAHPHHNVSQANCALKALPDSWHDSSDMKSYMLALGKIDDRQHWTKYLCERNFLRIDPTRADTMDKIIGLKALWYVNEESADQTDLRRTPYFAAVSPPSSGGVPHASPTVSLGVPTTKVAQPALTQTKAGAGTTEAGRASNVVDV
mmetsp:Transcript_41975/g.115819  ORF Transcript_41975/g.115819 Transcript_41975/m.115819 type:complete len:855 (-) Transcript_41975:175-2739(-)